MPQTPRHERHFLGSESIRDIVIGMSDGLTMPFALAAGLSGIANSTAIVITGGLVPLAPYILISKMGSALRFSVGFTLVALLIFGYVKGRFTGAAPIRSGLQTALIGGLAAAAAFGLAKLISE